MKALATKLLVSAGLGTAGYMGLRWLAAQRFQFENKTVLISGGSRGLGHTLTQQLLAAGARVAVCARHESELRACVDQLADGTGRLLAIPTDITKREEVRDLVNQVEGQWGRIDVLINNAGTIQVGPRESMTREDFETSLGINFWGAYELTMAALPGMLRRGAGRIVNICSIGGKVSIPHLLPYSTSKFAMVGFSDGLRAELIQRGVIVTTVCPGLMRTGSPRNAIFKGRHRLEYGWFSISDSLPGLTLSAETAAARILYACRCGDAHVVLSLPAKILALMYGVTPDLVVRAMGQLNRLLPGPGGVGTRAYRGYESESFLSPSWLTGLSERAARDHNQRRWN